MSGVGKSSIYTQFIYQTFTEDYATTIGSFIQFKALELAGSRVKLQIWDTAGQERFHSITSSYFQRTHCVVFVLDLEDPISLEAITHFWYEETLKHVDKRATLLVLVGNKADLPRRVSVERVAKFCSE
jgi:small GTP-binding protein